jgi:hypothetical protein
MANITITLSSSATLAANTLCIAQKRNKRENATQMLTEVVNNYIFRGYEAIADGVAELEAKRYDSIVESGFTPTLNKETGKPETKAEYVARMSKRTSDVLAGLKLELKK